MKQLVLIFVVLATLKGHSQVNISLQLPPSGLSLKSQLWNMIVNNSSGAVLEVHAEIRLTEVATNRQVMTAVTNTILLTPGNQFLQYSSWAPVRYNITDPSYQGFAASEFLPVGRFVACYSLLKHNSDESEKIIEECEIIEIEPLSPPQLVYPGHRETIESENPVFNWIAPAPINLFTSMNYDLELVEMYNGQTENDAIRQNIPLFNQSAITMTSYPYSTGAPRLEAGKKYAWRILAKNNDAVVAQTETWWFTVKDSHKKDSVLKSELPFAKLKKDNQLSYAIAENELKFEYLNETADTTWNLRIYDISKAGKREMALPLDSIALNRGQNMVTVSAEQLKDFTDKHLYLLQVRNSREELWQLKFEYRRSENEK